MRTLNRIEIKNFGNHSYTNIRIANTGLYVFTGATGAGKSTIIDAIVWALYKRSIRAKSGWTPITRNSSVYLQIEDISLERGSRLYIKENKNLYVGKNANDRCMALFGTYKDFIRSFILHKRYVSRFSMATAAEKKTVLESILGFDLLDNAYSQVKKANKELLDSYNSLSIKKKSLSLDISALERSIEDIDLLFQFSDYSKSLRDLQYKIENFVFVPAPLLPDTSEKDAIRKSLFENELYYNNTITKIIEDLERSLNRDKCTFCGSTNIDTAYVKTCIDSNKQKLDVYNNEIKPKLEKEHEDVLNAYTAKYNEYKKQLSKHMQNKEAYRDLINKKEHLESYISSKLEASNRIVLLRDELYYKKQQYEIFDYNLNVLSDRLDRCKTYTSIYGNTGLRLKLLSDTIHIVEDNILKIYHNLLQGHIEHTHTFKPILRVKENSIFLGVNKKGTIVPYVGLSEGEKGLLDIAILKSLYYLTPKQALFPTVYDDIFDAFDDDITEKLIRFVCNESENKPVFLITHNNKLLDIINRYTDNIKHYHVSNGCIGYGNS